MVPEPVEENEEKDEKDLISESKSEKDEELENDIKVVIEEED